MVIFTKGAGNRSTPSGATDRSEGATAIAGAVPFAPDGPEIVVGSTLGRYVVLEELGRGAMGRVLRAYDPKLQREVALKEVHRGVHGDERRRMVQEARAMARVSHPNVVAIYDVEELSRDRLVLVMELVDGQTLKDWLRRSPRAWREIVRSFVQAGRGLAAAHAAGLLHRDFKTANVLVATDTVKVTDFGLAKTQGHASESPSSIDAVGWAEVAQGDLTEAGVVLGTPRYMAPEQHRGEALTPAADQYALCVALWEALCGAPPFTGKKLLSKKEQGPPRWPDPNRAHPAHKATPTAIVEAITRGLSPDPGKRWPSMDALLDALAYDPAHRRRRWFTGIGIVAMLVAAGGGWRAWATAVGKRCSGAQDQLSGIWDAQRRAEAEAAVLGVQASFASPVWRRTSAELDAYAAQWMDQHEDACEATSVRKEQSSEVMDLRMACLHRAKLELDAVAEVLARADAAVVAKAHELVAALRPLSRCRDVAALREDVEPPLPKDVSEVDAVRSHLAAAKALRNAGHYRQAHIEAQAAEEILSQVDYGPAHAEVALEHGAVLAALGEYDAAQDVFRGGLMQASRWHQWDEMGSIASQLLYLVGVQQQRFEEGLLYMDIAQGLAQDDPLREANWRHSFGGVLEGQGQYKRAEAEYRRALALREEVLGPEHPKVASSRNSLGNALEFQGKYERAEEEHRRALSLWEAALGPEHPNTASAHNNLGSVLLAQGEHEEAEAEYRRALAIWVRALGSEHADVAISRNNLANVLERQGKYEAAEAEHRRALAIWEAALGPQHPHAGSSRNNLAIALQAQGKYEEAEAEHRRALAIREAALGPEHPHVATSNENLGNVLRVQGKYEDAEAKYRRALAIGEATLGAEHPDVAMSHGNLGSVLEKQDKHEEAERELRRALEIFEKALDPEHPLVAMSRHNLAHFLLARGKVVEARQIAELAWERRQQDDITPDLQANTAFLLARARWASGERHARLTGRELAEGALEAYRRAGTDGFDTDDRIAKVRAWLAEHPAP